MALEEPFPMHSKRVNKSESSHQKLATLQAHQDPAINAKETKKKSHNAFVSWIRKKFAKVKSQSWDNLRWIWHDGIIVQV